MSISRAELAARGLLNSIVASATVALCTAASPSGDCVSTSAEESLWDGVLALTARLHPLMVPLPSTVRIPKFIGVPLSIGFLIFLTGVYLIHFIAFFYSKYKVNKVVSYKKRTAGVSVVKPLVGVDDNLESNLETYFNVRYHEFELLFCVHDNDDPALSVVHRLMRKYPAVNARIFCGGEDVGLNPKINNMMPAYRAAKYPFILISDCSIRVQPEVLQDMANAMTEGVGLVTQTPFSVDRPGLGSALEKVYFGTSHARMYLAGNCMGFVCSTGMSCLLRKIALEECGGLQAFGRYLAEDYFFGVELVKRGWKTSIGTLPTMQNSAGVTADQFTARICRWMKLRIAMLPFTILLEPIQDCILSGILAASSMSYLVGMHSLIYFSLHTLFWFAMDYALISSLQNGPLKYTFSQFLHIWLIREASAFPTYLRALLQPEITWRRGTYRLRWGALCTSNSLISQGEYEARSNESLEKLYSYFDTFPEICNVSKEYDVSYAMGVLNVVVSSQVGTYVINKQSPNKQIWLSSPFSGPKRYDLIDQKWTYLREGECLDVLLTREFRKIYGSDTINFTAHI
ncbi:unnamed protein product, partial [Mesorhabditis belari]|uniref:Ceramide glucosyltransferase n=1 Tax=Mesorhabditis belari TaxID=2138241 RepID=A0AAF3EXY6_9BILA